VLLGQIVATDGILVLNLGTFLHVDLLLLI